MVHIILAAVALAAAPVSDHSRIFVKPTEIHANLFFSGAEVHVEAEVPKHSKVAIELRGKSSAVDLKKKGKVLGALWMNVGDVSFQNVPAVYMLATSDNIRTLASETELERVGVGREAVAGLIKGKGNSIDTEALDNLLKLKESEGLFSSQINSVRLQNKEQDSSYVKATATFHLPAKVPLGSYKLRVLAFHEGQGRVLYEKNISVDQIGLARWVKDVAHHNGLFYGIGAAVIALVVGMLTGFLFGLRSKSAH